MTIREETEELEYKILSPYAAHSADSEGRERQEDPCDIRTCYQRDRDRILHCKSFRRLMHKTQVFLAPEGDHYRTRLTHTLEVAQIARTIAKALRMNEDLTEAIALAHDLGHTPFGHAGEDALDQKMQESGKHFKHNEQSVRVVKVLEKDGAGLNLTGEVIDGIYNHELSGNPSTCEGKIVRLSDKIAYLHHDIDDAIRAEVLREEDLPKKYTDVLGNSVHDRLNKMVHDIIETSRDKPDILQSEEVEEAMRGLREFMFVHVYRNPEVKGEESKAKEMLAGLFDYYCKNWDRLPEEYAGLIGNRRESIEQVVCDYIAGMTDHYATAQFEELFVPKGWEHY